MFSPLHPPLSLCIVHRSFSTQHECIRWIFPLSQAFSFPEIWLYTTYGWLIFFFFCHVPSFQWQVINAALTEHGLLRCTDTMAGNCCWKVKGFIQMSYLLIYLFFVTQPDFNFMPITYWHICKQSLLFKYLNVTPLDDFMSLPCKFDLSVAIVLQTWVKRCIEQRCVTQTPSTPTPPSRRRDLSSWW